jgi:DNA-binding transcriptional ArsR family regulator
MSLLSRLLSSQVRAALLRILFGLSGEELHLREIGRRSGLSIGTVRQDIAKLTDLGLVVARRSGNRLYYKANKEHPLFPEIHRIVLKTAGLADILRERLGVKGIVAAFVFGSIAAETPSAGSDVDLMIIGSVSLREVSGRLTGVSEVLGREVNPYILTAAEFNRRLHEKEHFLGQVMESPKIFVKGVEDDLAAMGN